MASVSMRLSDAELEVLDQLAKDNGVNRSEQIRQGLSKHIELCRKVYDGNFVVTLPSVGVDKMFATLTDLKSMKQQLDENSPIIPMIDVIFNAVQFDTGSKVIEKQPDELIRFDFENGIKQANLYQEAINEGLDTRYKLER